MNEVTIITNNVPRFTLDAGELTAAERAEFEYLDWDALERGEESAEFFRYKGEVYDLGDIPARSPWVPTDEPDPFVGWDAVLSDSFFSGIVVRFCDDHESIVVGWFCC